MERRLTVLHKDVPARKTLREMVPRLCFVGLF